MKKLTSIIVTLAMLFSIAAAAFAAEKEYPQRFWDVPKDHWAFTYIAELVNRGVLAGYEDGSFQPDNTVTRSEWAKIMVLAAGLQPDDNEVYFADMSNHWANIYVNSAKDYLAAYADGSFKPDQAAVREDVTVSMVKLKGYDISRADYSQLNPFTDTASISNSLKQYVAVAIEKGLITGFEDNTFRGQDTLTRAEAATLLWRAFQYGNDNKVVDSPTQPIPSQNQQKPSETPKPTAKPGETSSTPKPTAKPSAEPTPKAYKVDTLKSVELKRDFTYDGDSIYYLSGTTVYKMNPQTGKASSFYDASKLKLQETEMQEKEVTKTITKTVPVEKTDSRSEDGENESGESSGGVEGGEIKDEETGSDAPQTEEITEEVMEIVQEEVVVKEYTSYVPVQIIYDQYNNRLVLNGYYKNIEEAFKSPQNNASYYVAYDITNNELYKEFGQPYNDNRIIQIKCFVSKDKAIIYNYTYDDSYLYNMQSMSNMASMMDKYGTDLYWAVGSNIYAEESRYQYPYQYHSLYQYDFSGNQFNNIYKFPAGDCKMNVNGGDLYYWNLESKEKNLCKLNLSSGKVTALDINASSDNCEVKDMAAVNANNIWTIIVPVSDNYIVFYDSAAKAFRALSKN